MCGLHVGGGGSGTETRGGFGWEGLKDRRDVTGRGVDGKIILEGMLKEYYGNTLAGYMRFNIRRARSLNYKGFLKCREFVIS
jgi:hypothetical protein